MGVQALDGCDLVLSRGLGREEPKVSPGTGDQKRSEEVRRGQAFRRWRRAIDKVRLSDRIKRIEMIGKHVDVKAFTERKEVTGKDGAPIEAVMVFNPVGNDDDLG